MVASRKGDAQHTRGRYGILDKSNAEVAATEEQDGIGMLAFHVLKLLHHWGEFLFCHMIYDKIRGKSGGIE